jgi:hypothetical protein
VGVQVLQAQHQLPHVESACLRLHPAEATFRFNFSYVFIPSLAWQMFGF